MKKNIGAQLALYQSGN